MSHKLVYGTSSGFFTPIWVLCCPNKFVGLLALFAHIQVLRCADEFIGLIAASAPVLVLRCPNEFIEHLMASALVWVLRCPFIKYIAKIWNDIAMVLADCFPKVFIMARQRVKNIADVLL